MRQQNEAQALALWDNHLLDTKDVSDKKILELTTLVGELSNSLLATRKRQSQLAELMEASLRNLNLNLASSEARFEKALDGRLGRFEQTQNEEAKANEETLKTLTDRLETETERNDNVLSDFRASLAKIEQNLASSEARFEEALDGRLGRFEQAKGKEVQAMQKIVEELMGKGNIREAIEMHWNKQGG